MDSQQVNSQQILTQLKLIAYEQFKIAGDRVLPEARLREDLDLDSIDMFDLLAILEERLGRSLVADQFRNVRTVSDFIATVMESIPTSS